MRAALFVVLAMLAGACASNPPPPPAPPPEPEPAVPPPSPTCFGEIGQPFASCLGDKLTKGEYETVITACRHKETVNLGDNAVACVTMMPTAYFLSERTQQASMLLMRACRDLGPRRKQQLAATCVYTTAVALHATARAPEEQDAILGSAAKAFAAACDSDPNDVATQAADMDKSARKSR